jgi:hypothetical protein
MTPQEQQMINGLIDRVQKTQLGEKDADSERLLQTGLGRNPDSLYILSQTVLVQQYALDQAQQQLTSLKAQVEQLQSQQQHAKPATSFLGSLFGGGSNDRPAAAPPPPQQSAGQYAPVPGYAPQSGYAQSGYAPSQSFGGPAMGAPSQGGGFLRGAMQTAAGVAAGALAFEGVESLMHGFGNSMTGMGGGGGRPEEIVNNYYGGGNDRGSNFADDDRSRDNSDPGDNVFTDSSDRNNFAASGNDTSSDLNDSSLSDGSDSDGSSFDDGGDSMSDDSSSDDSF